MEKKKEYTNVTIGYHTLITVLLVVLVVLAGLNQYFLFTISSEITKGVPTGRAVTGQTTEETSQQTGGSDVVNQVLAEITPTGTPDYGDDAGVSYDEVVAGLNTLSGYHRSISLDGDDLERYKKIATTQDTACRYCCGIGTAGFGRSDGNIACGCSHNVAFSGLTKWLLKNTDYSDEQIIDEIHKWRVLYFPEPSVRQELEKRGISPESAGLQKMVGGC